MKHWELLWFCSGEWHTPGDDSGYSYVYVCLFLQDVLVFDPSKVGTDHYSLHRIGMSIESFDAYYVELEESTYEVKVRAWWEIGVYAPRLLSSILWCAGGGSQHGTKY